MTSKERVNAMFARRDQDRVPRYETFWPETIERWQAEGLEGDADAVLNEYLHADIQKIVWFWPVPFPGQKEILEETDETETYKDANGGIVRFWKHKSGTPEHIGFSCTSRDIWETDYKPAMIQQDVTIDLEEVRTRFAEAARHQRWTVLCGVEAFEAIRKIIGDEEAMMSMMDDPEWIADIAKVEADLLLKNYQAVLDAGIQPDGLWIFGDMAFKNMTFCSPDTYRELIWPQHKRIADWAHAHDMKMIFHSDGDLRGVMDLYIEAGFDCLQPLECKASMDIRTLIPTYGDRLAFFGNVDVMTLLTNDLDRIEQEVKNKLEAGKQSKGYIYHSDHSVPPQMSWESYQALIGMLDTYGKY